MPEIAKKNVRSEEENNVLKCSNKFLRDEHRSMHNVCTSCNNRKFSANNSFLQQLIHDVYTAK